jgi:hypothetical protein
MLALLVNSVKKIIVYKIENKKQVHPKTSLSDQERG